MPTVACRSSRACSGLCASGSLILSGPCKSILPSQELKCCPRVQGNKDTAQRGHSTMRKVLCWDRIMSTQDKIQLHHAICCTECKQVNVTMVDRTISTFSSRCSSLGPMWWREKRREKRNDGRRGDVVRNVMESRPSPITTFHAYQSQPCCSYHSGGQARNREKHPALVSPPPLSP